MTERNCIGCVFTKRRVLVYPKAMIGMEENCGIGEDPYAKGECNDKITTLPVGGFKLRNGRVEYYDRGQISEIWAKKRKQNQ